MDASQSKSSEAFKITGDWAAQAKQLKEKNPKLTDADLKFEAGKEEALISRLETRLGKKREEVITMLKPVTTNKSDTNKK
jgi:uncharacterized protein YjbJ (UPF0337 family)